MMKKEHVLNNSFKPCGQLDKTTITHKYIVKTKIFVLLNMKRTENAMIMLW